MKVLAMYLPQFHRVKENDEWWGEGFTEWTAVRSAEKLFDGHEQPRVPLNGNYYDLLQKNTMKWQAELMKQYDIDGMCFYHYYFKKGRKILEKPAENLLKWRDIDMPFCFSWANESWVRSWSRFSKGDSNSWSLKFEKIECSNFDGVLLEQEYGDREAWKSHYEYLSNFFKDDRYIKHDGMPVFMIYKPLDIVCLKEMLDMWDNLSKQDGFPGIYTIGTNAYCPEKQGLKGSNLQEPQDTFRRFYSERTADNFGVQRIVNYTEAWENLIAKDVPKGASLGGFVGYDDTPRRGFYGSVIKDRSPFVFYEGIKKLLIKAKKNKSPFVFINAWNEWGEGMYLEPDERFENQFLEAFKQAKKDADYLEDKDIYVDNDEDNLSLRIENNALMKKAERYRGYWKIFDTWMSLLENCGTVADYLQKMGYKNVAVYGYGMLGKHLVHQLKTLGVCVDYVIESNIGKETDGIPMYSLDGNLPEVDAVIVTVMYDYDKIYEDLKDKIKAEILPITRLLE